MSSPNFPYFFYCVYVYLQVCVSLCQQALDLFGHGVKHQLHVYVVILYQLLPLKRQHHARILSYLQEGHFIRSDQIDVWVRNLTQNGRSGDQQHGQCEYKAESLCASQMSSGAPQ